MTNVGRILSWPVRAVGHVVTRTLTWLSDWRNIAVVLVAIVVGLLVATVVDAITSKDATLRALQDSQETQRDSRAAATAQIANLESQIVVLNERIAAGEGDRAALRVQIDVLAEQIRRLRAEPIVVVAPRSAPSPSGSSSTTTTTQPPGRPSDPGPSTPPPTTPPTTPPTGPPPSGPIVPLPIPFCVAGIIGNCS